MGSHITFFKESLSVISKNPILFLLPLIGSVLSIAVEIIFTEELRNSNGNRVFFPDTILFGLFFAAFTIIYFQLALSKKSLRINTLKNNDYSIVVLELFIIYSIYSLIIVFIGGYESQLRESYSVKLDRFSAYTSKITTYHDVINVIPVGAVIVLSYTITSFSFTAWMVQYVVIKDQDTRYGLAESLKRLARASKFNDTRKKMLLLFLVTMVISVLDFILTNIAVVRISDSSQLYLYQFLILSVVDSLYAPFFLICLFILVLSRPFQSTT